MIHHQLIRHHSPDGTIPFAECAETGAVVPAPQMVTLAGARKRDLLIAASADMIRTDTIQIHTNITVTILSYEGVSAVRWPGVPSSRLTRR